MSKWIFENRPVPQYTPVGTGSTVRHPTPLGTTTVPYPPHTSALGVPGERISADAQLGGGARGDTPSRGQITPSPGRGGSARTEGFTASSEAFPTRGVAPTLTSRQHLTTVNVKIFTPISRYNPPNFNIKFSTLKSGHFFKKSEKKYLTDPNLQSNKKIVKPERDRRFYTNSI